MESNTAGFIYVCWKLPEKKVQLTAAVKLLFFLYFSESGIIPNVPASILGQVENILNRIKAVWPQFELDGVKNVWIVKPGAKSRGRGTFSKLHTHTISELVMCLTS